MKKLRRKSRGWPLANLPRTEEERQIALGAGFIELRSGEWVMPEPNFSPSLQALQKYPYGHSCKACKSSFRSTRARDPYCPSCHNIINDKLRKLDLILRAALELPEEKRRRAWEEIEKELICPICGWGGNQNRYEPESIQQMLDFLPRWVDAIHNHIMHHVFWNRFTKSLRFAPKVAWEKRAEEERAFRTLAELFEEEPPSLEIVPLGEFQVPMNSAGGLTTVEIDLLARSSELRNPRPIGWQLVPKRCLTLLAHPGSLMLKTSGPVVRTPNWTSAENIQAESGPDPSAGKPRCPASSLAVALKVPAGPAGAGSYIRIGGLEPGKVAPKRYLVSKILPSGQKF